MSKFTPILSAALIALTSTFAQATDLVVGGKGFTEQLVVASMTEQYLAEKGYKVDKRDGMGSTVLRKAQENGQIDLYWEYTGTSLITFNKIKDRMSAEEAYAKVKQLDGEKGLIWLTPSKANNTYALAMRATDAAEKNIVSISDFANYVKGEGKDTVFASNVEFAARPDGLKPLQKEYKFKFARKNIKKMNSGLTYQALKNGDVDISLVFATDGRIKAFNFAVLQDDKGFFPNYALAPVVRKDTLESNPALAEQLNTLSALLNDDVMATLNAAVDVEGKSVESVAKQFLIDNKLI
ncbi:glycine betaine ABC transporter substrate-binding protein [Vibrio panuliri]|uniref:Glycine/betaine ABC transporter substrate-binding protein n=1 Tax=Vibrio panuliri TaxID=1381081 RepID=A0ABX3F2R6_9VIBR|nr:glycine betaine ABC transporter substrate-binding protein [Vibrio panuliri]KAB1453914.1 glycine betaine ABC transporter substrate-binding protein [Vibrio panuliri]OLQ83979.1 glycine/betaine ABC transporter substrate-binding protein [Vibrio panuliri]